MQLFLLLFQLVICVWGWSSGERTSRFFGDSLIPVFQPCECFVLIACGGWRSPLGPCRMSQSEPGFQVAEPALLREPGPTPSLHSQLEGRGAATEHSHHPNSTLSLLLDPPSTSDSVTDSGGILKPKVCFHRKSVDIY